MDTLQKNASGPVSSKDISTWNISNYKLCSPDIPISSCVLVANDTFFFKGKNVFLNELRQTNRPLRENVERKTTKKCGRQRSNNSSEGSLIRDLKELLI